MIKYLFHPGIDLLSLDDVEMINDTNLDDQDVKCNRLKIFDKVGLESSYTDFAYALGGQLVYDDNRRLVSMYQLKSDLNIEGIQAVVGDHIMGYSKKSFIYSGIRVTSKLQKADENNVQTDDNGIPFIYKGEYPQTVASKDEKWVVINTKFYDGFKWVVPKLTEKDYKGYAKEYILENDRFVELYLTNFYGSRLLSNGTEISRNTKAYFKVEPIKWLVDEETGLLVSEKIISSSMPTEYVLGINGFTKKLANKNKKN